MTNEFRWIYGIGTGCILAEILFLGILGLNGPAGAIDVQNYMNVHHIHEACRIWHIFASTHVDSRALPQGCKL